MGKQRNAYTTSSCLRPMVTELHNENSVSIIVNSACFYSKPSEFGHFQLNPSEIWHSIYQIRSGCPNPGSLYRGKKERKKELSK